MTRRWLFADQLGPHHLDAPDQPVLLVESRAGAAARQLLAVLSRDFESFDVTATGLALWRYEGGPWTAVRTEPFTRTELSRGK